MSRLGGGGSLGKRDEALYGVGVSLGKRYVKKFEMLARRAVDIKPARYFCFCYFYRL